MSLIDLAGSTEVLERVRRLGRLWSEVPRIPTTTHLAERAALVQLLFGPRTPAAVSSALESVDRARLLELAARYAATAPLAEALLAPELAGVAPSALLAELKERRIDALLQNRLLLADAARLARALDEAGLAHLFLKGTALLLYHPTLAARHVDDIDLLVRVEDGPAIDAALRSAGFDVEESGRMRHPLIAHGPGGTLVEVHYGLDDGLDDGLWGRAVRVPLDGRTALVPATDDLYAHLSHHVLVQHARAPRYLLRHLFDVAALDAAGAPRPTAPSPLATSFELLDLVSSAAGSPAKAWVLGALLFPTRHTTLHLAVARRLRLGFRGLGPELRALARVPAYLLYDVE